MRKTATILAAAGMVSLSFAAPAHAAGPSDLHGHVLVLGVEYDEVTGEPTGFRKCIDLAAGKPVPLNAHHERMHRGTAGEALGGAGHAVVPTFDFANCAALEEMFGH